MKSNKFLLPSVLLTATCLSIAPVRAADSPSDRVQENSKPGTAANPGTGPGNRSGSAMGENSTTGRSANMEGMTGRPNMSGQTNVRSLQEALRDKGFDPGPIDGVMGPQTRQALQSFQRSKNITTSGELNAETSQHLGLQPSGAMGTDLDTKRDRSSEIPGSPSNPDQGSSSSSGTPGTAPAGPRSSSPGGIPPSGH